MGKTRRGYRRKKTRRISNKDNRRISKRKSKRKTSKRRKSRKKSSTNLYGAGGLTAHQLYAKLMGKLWAEEKEAEAAVAHQRQRAKDADVAAVAERRRRDSLSPSDYCNEQYPGKEDEIKDCIRSMANPEQQSPPDPYDL